MLYAREAGVVVDLLGERILEIHHVGSTSVPGLSAKPIIDILLVVGDSAAEDDYVPLLEAGGYWVKVREPEWHEHRMLKGPDTDVNLHVFSEGNLEIERVLLFRNRLRTHPTDRDLYERAKRDLARQEWDVVQDYADAKGEVVEEIIARAPAEG